MFNRNEWLEWAKQNQENNPIGRDFRSTYWKVDNNNTKKSQNLNDSIKQVMDTEFGYIIEDEKTEGNPFGAVFDKKKTKPIKSGAPQPNLFPELDKDAEDAAAKNERRVELEAEERKKRKEADAGTPLSDEEMKAKAAEREKKRLADEAEAERIKLARETDDVHSSDIERIERKQKERLTAKDPITGAETEVTRGDKKPETRKEKLMSAGKSGLRNIAVGGAWSVGSDFVDKIKRSMFGDKDQQGKGINVSGVASQTDGVEYYGDELQEGALKVMRALLRKEVTDPKTGKVITKQGPLRTPAIKTAGVLGTGVGFALGGEAAAKVMGQKGLDDPEAKTRATETKPEERQNRINTTRLAAGVEYYGDELTEKKIPEWMKNLKGDVLTGAKWQLGATLVDKVNQRKENNKGTNMGGVTESEQIDEIAPFIVGSAKVAAMLGAGEGISRLLRRKPTKKKGVNAPNVTEGQIDEALPLVPIAMGIGRMALKALPWIVGTELVSRVSGSKTPKKPKEVSGINQSGVSGVMGPPSPSKPPRVNTHNLRRLRASKAH